MLRSTLLASAIVAATLLPSITPAEAAPGGSYLASCGRVQQRGPILTAVCRDRDGRRVPTSLDVRDCGRGDIANIDGRLSCRGGGRGGDRERSYRRY